ncbi:DUF6702 family protein [Oleisolibacter albus]|uniref:DUF6702 family protein n=1 Tax=Oleisolibacter albus TaxID=2171757 RepID=UPI0012D80112|nr:DUF6702 family protein [Oleisolibacter albus]
MNHGSLTRRRLLAAGLTLAGPALAIGVAGTLAARPALAHRAKASTSWVRWNPRNALLEISHRLHAHDAEVALHDIEGVSAPDVGVPRTQAQLALYVEKHFALRDAAGNPLDLTLLGAEQEGDQLYIYQQRPLPQPPPAFGVRDSILTDVFPEQQNQVNLDNGLAGAAGIRTLIFKAGDGWKRAEF